MRIAFKTFGCRANSLDTDALYLEAKRRGFQIVDETEVADAYVINSCTVTSAADRDARSHVIRYKRRNPEALVGVVGCYAQVAKDELLALQQVDFVVGTANKARILDHLMETGAARDQVEPPLGYLPEAFPGSRHARANIKIQDGCNFACSFCIIPQARGRSRSLPVGTVLAQIDEAHALGFNEVVLTGIHIAHYGWDRGTSLDELLERIFERRGGPRVRVSTLDPFEISDGLIAMLGREERLCPHFHIAIQSGSDKVLAGMRRIYKAEEFVTVTKKIEAQCPDTFIGVDVIVGFPGEGEAELQETIDVLSRSFWAKLHVFPFSERAGTRAQGMPGKVRDGVITERSATLRRLSDERYARFLAGQVGKRHEVLLEKPSRKHPGLWLGHTANYVPTLSEAPDGAERKIVVSTSTGTSGERLRTAPLH